MTARRWRAQVDSVHIELGEIYDLHCHRGIRIPTFDLAIRWLVHIFDKHLAILVQTYFEITFIIS